jgi:hypothetical protein
MKELEVVMDGMRAVKDKILVLQAVRGQVTNDIEKQEKKRLRLINDLNHCCGNTDDDDDGVAPLVAKSISTTSLAENLHRVSSELDKYSLELQTIQHRMKEITDVFRPIMGEMGFTGGASMKCEICFLAYTHDDKVIPTALQCGHIFCQQCVKHLRGNHYGTKCPTCRARVTQSFRVYL